MIVLQREIDPAKGAIPLQPPKTATVTILATSDIHGCLSPTHYRDRTEQPLGLAKLAAVIREQRGRHPGLLLIDNGDLLQGSPMAAYHYRYRRQDVHPAVRLLNALHYDAAVVGNHEFNYGADMLEHAVRHSAFPWLAANVLDKQTGEPAFGQPYRIFATPEGIRIALLGVTTAYIPNWEHPDHIAPYRFEDAAESARVWVARIREAERPDAVIVAYHGGFERDLATGEPSERLTGENQGYAIAAGTPGLDALVTGHQHRLIAGTVNGIPVLQPGCHGQAIGKLTLRFAATPSGWRVAGAESELLYVDDATPADETAAALLAEYEPDVQQWLDRPIGRTDGDLRIRDPFEARLRDNPFIAFIQRVQMEASGAPISCTALLSNESRGFDGVITLRDVLANFMYPNTLKVLRLAGRDIKEALEQSAEYFVVDEDEAVAVNPAYLEPKAQHYNYDMWAGIRYVLDIARPPGARVASLTFQGEPLAMDGEYDVVMNSYRAGGGGNYDMFKGKPVVREIDTDYAEMIAAYIEAKGTVAAEHTGGWRVARGFDEEGEEVR